MLCTIPESALVLCVHCVSMKYQVHRGSAALRVLSHFGTQNAK
jgi:hypothetical protein